MEVRWTAAALVRLRDIRACVAAREPDRAADVLQRLFEAVLPLAETPRIGRRLPGYSDDEIRELFARPYRILYRVTPLAIEILTVKHFRQRLIERPDDYSSQFAHRLTGHGRRAAERPGGTTTDPSYTPPMLGRDIPAMSATAATLGALSPTDRIVLAYALTLGVIGLLNGARTSLVVLAALMVLVIALARRAARSQRFALVHAFAPIAFVLLLYGLTAPIIMVANPARWDATLVALDAEWFGTLPAAWTGLFGRPAWLTGAASVCYATFYLLPIAIVVALYRSQRRAQFDYFVFVVVATFIASYIGYLLVPASGPRVAPGDVTALGGVAMDGWLHAFLHRFERNRFDAFPSGHTALSLVYLVLGWRYFRAWRWRAPLAIACGGIVFSTVYLSLHYVIDVAAGALLAAIMLFGAPALYRFVARWRLRPRPQACGR